MESRHKHCSFLRVSVTSRANPPSGGMVNTVSRRSKLIARTVSRCAPGATRTKRQDTGVAEAPSESTVTKIDTAGPPRVCAVTRMIPVESASARPTIGGGGPESAGNHSQRSTDLPTTREWQALVAMPNEKARSAALRMGAIRLRPRGTTVPDAAIWMHRLTIKVQLQGHAMQGGARRAQSLALMALSAATGVRRPTGDSSPRG